MSGFITHALIGAVGGLALAHVPGVSTLLGDFYGERELTPLVLAATSAVLATWPDIDEPGTWISHRAPHVLALMFLVLGALGGWMLARTTYFDTASPEVLALIGAAIGLLLSPLLARLTLRAIEAASGGHRHLTHSLTLAIGMSVAGWLAWGSGNLWLAVMLGALVWGELLHLLGDVVTPAGVPLWYPFSSRRARIPHPLALIGEPIMALAALGVGAYLLVR